VGDEYIFGGAQTGNPPFRLDGTYLGDDTVRMAQIDDQLAIETNHTGNVMLGSALAALTGVTAQLANGTPESIRAGVETLADAQQDVLTAQTQVGSRLNQIQLTNRYLGERIVTFADRRDAVRDADPTEAALEVMAAQTALERSYAVIGRVLSTNLLDFLQ
jgi:flagellar hook-associated protein 3 FlgL